ncbi:hypothetical protein ACHAPT_008321 [Fusarium lateritium]
MICSESTVISIALSELQMRILRRDDLSQAWASRTDVLVAFETALTGCMVVFSCLEAETRQLQLQNSARMGVWAKIRFMWNQDRLKDLLTALRGQQTSISFLLNILETEALSDIQRNIRDNGARIQAPASQAQSLRSRNPSIRMESESIFDNDTAKLSLFDVEIVSAVAPSELDFEFDNLVLDSQAYRRAFARAQANNEQPQIQVIEGDLIDFTETQSAIDNSDAATIRELNQDLQGLNMGADPETEEPTSDSTGATTPRQRRNSWEKQDNSFSLREIERPKNQDEQESKKPPPEKPRTGLKCKKCSQNVTGQFVRALDGVWHLDCFRCVDCSEIVAKRYFPLDEEGSHQKPLCERDYFRRLDLICFRCDQALRGSYVTALGLRYHVEHFSCEVCDAVFEDKTAYYEHSGQVLCMFDYLRLYAKRCDSCDFPILGKYVDFLQRDLGVVYHAECYMIKKELGIDLSVSKRGTEFLALLGKEEVTDNEKTGQIPKMQEQHEAFIANLKVAIVQFLDVFRNNATATLEASKENQGEAFENLTVLIALTNLLFQVVANTTDGRPSDKDLKRFGNAFNKYAQAFIPGSNSNAESLCKVLSNSVKAILKAGLESALTNPDRNKLDKFMARMSATALPKLRLPYETKPPRGTGQGVLCEVCNDFVRKEAYTEDSMPNLRWHPDCWACVACRRPGIIKPTPSQATAGQFECDYPDCRWGGIVNFIPSYAQTVYLMWRTWGIVVQDGHEGPIKRENLMIQD